MRRSATRKPNFSRYNPHEKRRCAPFSAGSFTAVYVPFLAGFAALLVAPPDGPRRATIFIATVVASDVGGYAAGVLFGKHPMAPTVSPKKSWEGFAGSTLACIGAGIAGVVWLLD